jgi:hypothetical protein
VLETCRGYQFIINSIDIMCLIGFTTLIYYDAPKHLADFSVYVCVCVECAELPVDVTCSTSC